jgi:serine/threonine protein phosphatase 1
MPASHLRLLERLRLMAVFGDFVFVHAGVRPGTPLSQQSEEDLLWIRQDFLGKGGPFEKVVVHGHTWVDDAPRLTAHRVGLDTGAYQTGVLTAVWFDGAERDVLQARGAAASGGDVHLLRGEAGRDLGG